MNELTLSPLGDIPQTQPGQTVYVSLVPFVIPWWAWAVGAGITAYALLGKQQTRTIRRRPKTKKKEEMI